MTWKKTGISNRMMRKGHGEGKLSKDLKERERGVTHLHISEGSLLGRIAAAEKGS